MDEALAAALDMRAMMLAEMERGDSFVAVAARHRKGVVSVGE